MVAPDKNALDSESSLTVAEILHAIRYPDGVVPEAAIRAVMSGGPEMADLLLSELRDACETVDDFDLPMADSHAFAVVLLAARGDSQALPEIVEAFRTDAENDDVLFGDMLLNNFPHIVAKLADTAEFVFYEIQNDRNPVYFRAAMLDALFEMAVRGKMSRKDLAEQLKTLLDEELQRFPRSEMMDFLVRHLSLVGLKEYENAVSEAFRRNTVDVSFISAAECAALLQGGDQTYEEECQRSRQFWIEDPVKAVLRIPGIFDARDVPQGLDDALRLITGEEVNFKSLPGVRWLRGHQEEAVPALLNLLRVAAESDPSGDRVASLTAADIAVVLLTEFEVREALTPILKAVCHPEAGLRLPLAIRDCLDQAVGRLAKAPDDISGHVMSSELSYEVRSQLCDGIVWMAMERRISRETAIECLQRWLKQGVVNHDIVLVTAVVESLGALGAVEAESEINEAYNEGCVDEDYANQEEIEEFLAEGPDRFASVSEIRLKARRIEHSVYRVLAWIEQPDLEAEFEESLEEFESGEDTPWDDDEEWGDEEEWDDDLDLPYDPFETRSGGQRPVENRNFPGAADTVRPIRRDEPKVGRNDPCSCGSGKKFKKCCGK